MNDYTEFDKIFDVDETLICVTNQGAEGRLTRGKEYAIEGIDQVGRFIILYDDNGELDNFQMARFVSKSDIQKEFS